MRREPGIATAVSRWAARLIKKTIIALEDTQIGEAGKFVAYLSDLVNEMAGQLPIAVQNLTSLGCFCQ